MKVQSLKVMFSGGAYNRKVSETGRWDGFGTAIGELWTFLSKLFFL